MLANMTVHKYASPVQFRSNASQRERYDQMHS